MLKTQTKVTLITISLLMSFTAVGKEIAVTPFYGYQFGGRASTDNGELRIKDSENYGVTLDIPYTGTTTVQLLYINQDTSLQRTDKYTGITKELFDMSVQYFHVGGTAEVAKGGTTSFVSGSLGATYFDPDTSGYSSETLFSFSFGMGLLKEISKNFAFRVQGRLLIPIQYGGGSMFCGSGGCAIGVSGGTTILQGDVTAGIAIRF
ncbi:MAG: hypothetical protein AMJ53_04155 [Gammaproteobacteria bacterium SG8_11]|nr:MAG: hypothetical protein AMJ53_04155 [Gammaproteobacteria bacterium SG8_11]